jgi:hypothetical protein
MKKTWLLVLVLAGMAAATAGVVYAEFKAGYYSTQVPGSIQQTPTQTGDADSTYDAGNYGLYNVDLPPGDGLDEVYQGCMTCHSTRYITMQPPLPAATWAAEVTKMNKAYGAGISDADADKIIHYLQAHYSPETRKQ